ncbi:amidohydrolase [Streptomyces sp. 4503]|uniref:Amidohydrolase n=1 Tax=Streptomyces niphimycinicus TaxID=2842201 RepID=A0ABS6CML2_9ACTN|nr:amidohydrolase [Streptomyces niphimycinicus]MBU3868168.1 amidohydrolase [Streptomyces niphimycinicus]
MTNPAAAAQSASPVPAAASAAASHRPERVRIFHARAITTLAGPQTQALAVLAGRIVATGGLAELSAAFPTADRTDLGDGHVVPGFHDAHCHPSCLAETKLRLHLGSGDTSVPPRERVAAAIAATPPGGWVTVEGYDPRADPEGRLDRAALDALAPGRPVVVIHFSCHMAVANSPALELAGFRDGDPAPAGGDLGRDATGRLDGWIYERAWFDEWYRAVGEPEFLPSHSIEDLVEPLAEVCADLHATGITSWCDALVTPKELRLYQLASERGRLTARVGMLLWFRYLDELRRAGLRAGFGDEWVRVVGVKLMADGALAGGTCLCSRPYRAETGGDNGIQVMGDEELAATVEAAHAAGLRVGVHANGDLAVGKVLDAIERARALHPRNTVNHRIEHCSMVDDALIERIRRSGVTPVPFGSFVHGHGAKLIGYYGDERAEQVCAHRDLLDAGITVAGSSDYPAGPLNPLLAVQTMVTRRTADGRVLGADQRLTVAQALEVYTAGSAHATGESHLKGRLAPGMLADFVVLGASPFDTDPDGISEIPVRSTWVGGRRVWSADS